MPIGMFKTVVTRIAAATSSEKVIFILHGGEPSLMSRRWLVEAAAHLKIEGRVFGKHLSMTMQSNAVALNETKLKLIQSIGCGLSVSLDGPPSMNEAMRQYAEHAETAFLKARELGINVGVLSSINHSNWNKFDVIMPWLHTKLGLRKFKANIISPVGVGAELRPLSAEQVVKAQSDILRYMIAHPGEIVEDNLYLELRRYFDGRSSVPKQLCREGTCGAGEKVIGVNKNGDILPCGRFDWNDEDHYLGNIDRTKAANIEEFKSLSEKFHAREPQVWADCSTCEARRICSYGCQAFIVRSQHAINVECKPTKLRYSVFQENEFVLNATLETIKERTLHA